jgi:competence protein ComEA
MRYLYTFIFTLLFMLSIPASAGPVDINTADATVLASTIDGVGEKKASGIIRYRETHGPFASVDELANVKGIGAVTVERNRQKLIAVSPARQQGAINTN